MISIIQDDIRGIESMTEIIDTVLDNLDREYTIYVKTHIKLDSLKLCIEDTLGLSVIWSIAYRTRSLKVYDSSIPKAA